MTLSNFHALLSIPYPGSCLGPYSFDFNLINRRLSLGNESHGLVYFHFQGSKVMHP